MLLPAQGCRRAAQVHLRGDSRRPSFELRVGRHPGRNFLPFWPGRGARSTSSGVGGKELQERRNAGAGEPNRPSSFRIAFTCSVGADLGRAAEKPLVADR